jgi:hypothetical protein
MRSTRARSDWLSRVLGPLLATTTVVGTMLAASGVVLALSAAPAHAVTRTALINSDTVSGACSTSFEATLATGDGFTVTCVDGATWDGMSAAQFAAYTVLIIGDPDCGDIASSVVSNVATWTKPVMDSGGNRFTIGSDPDFHAGGSTASNRAHIVKDGIAFAGALPGQTGAYVDTTCEASSNNTTILDHLSLAGTGWTVETPACAGSIGIVASNPAFADTHDADLSGWDCSSHSDYPTWATDWLPFAISADAPTKNYCANDIETSLQVCGEPYILVSGGGVTVKSDIALSPPSATNPVGTSHTVTATVTKGTSPEAGKTVTFSITSGPNAGKTGTGETNAIGQATFTYTDTGGAGTDTIVDSFTNDAGAVEETPATKTWEGTTGTTTTTAPPTTAPPTTGLHLPSGTCIGPPIACDPQPTTTLAPTTTVAPTTTTVHVIAVVQPETAPSTSATSGSTVGAAQLANTGENSKGLAWIALLLVGLGLAIVSLAGWRRWSGEWLLVHLVRSGDHQCLHSRRTKR